MQALLRLLALAAVLGLPWPAGAQSPPYFPQTLPPNTVVGRLGGGTTGPAEAIPFATLGPLLTVGGTILNVAGPLTVGSTNQTGNAFEVDGSTGAIQESIIDWTNDTSQAAINFRKSRGGAIGTMVVVNINDFLGSVVWRGVDSNSAWQVASQISGLADQSPIAGFVPGRLSFQTSSATTTNVERLRIDSNGVFTFGGGGFADLGQGSNYQFASTVQAGANLQIIKYSNDTGGNFVQMMKSRGVTVGAMAATASGDTIGQVRFNGNDGTQFSVAAGISALQDTTGGVNNIPGRLSFLTAPTGGSNSTTEALRIDSLQNTQSLGTLGYGPAALGVGGAVTQLTSRTTGVTLNTVSGQITMFSAAGSVTAATFTVTNSKVAATDTITLNQKSGTNLYNFLVTAVGAGSFNITFFTTGGTATDAPVIDFNVIKGVAS